MHFVRFNYLHIVDFRVFPSSGHGFRRFYEALHTSALLVTKQQTKFATTYWAVTDPHICHGAWFRALFSVSNYLRLCLIPWVVSTSLIITLCINSPTLPSVPSVNSVCWAPYLISYLYSHFGFYFGLYQSASSQIKQLTFGFKSASCMWVLTLAFPHTIFSIWVGVTRDRYLSLSDEYQSWVCKKAARC